MSAPETLQNPAGAFGLIRDQSIQLIVETALHHGVSDERQIAYILATAEHESQDFRRASEINGPSQALALGYSGGEAFYGRGYVQITHDHRYLAMGEALGLGRALYDDPERAATDPRLAADLLVVGMQRGLYTGHALERYVNEAETDFVNARRVVNGVDRASDIAALAERWQAQVPSLIEHVRQGPVDLTARPNQPGLDGFLSPGERGEDVRDFQRQLNSARGTELLVADGIFGEASRREVARFQQDSGLPVTGIANPATREAVARAALERSDDLPPPIDPALPGRDPRDPSHPDHDRFQRIEQLVYAGDARRGRTPDERSDNLVASLTVLSKRSGVEPLNLAFSVEDKSRGLLAGQNVFLYDGDPVREPWFQRTTMPTEQAIRTPVAESFRELDAVNRQMGQQQADAMAFTRSQGPPSDLQGPSALRMA